MNFVESMFINVILTEVLITTVRKDFFWPEWATPRGFEILTCMPINVRITTIKGCTSTLVQSSIISTNSFLCVCGVQAIDYSTKVPLYSAVTVIWILQVWKYSRARWLYSWPAGQIKLIYSEYELHSYQWGRNVAHIGRIGYTSSRAINEAGNAVDTVY